MKPLDLSDTIQKGLTMAISAKIAKLEDLIRPLSVERNLLSNDDIKRIQDEIEELKKIIILAEKQ